jgi:hypothetical protein
MMSLFPTEIPGMQGAPELTQHGSKMDLRRPKLAVTRPREAQGPGGTVREGCELAGRAPAVKDRRRARGGSLSRGHLR